MTQTTGLSLQFGLQPPANAIRAWGARAILNGTFIDLVWDRTDNISTEDHPVAQKAFGEWVATVGMPWLREHVERVGLVRTVAQRVAMVDGQYAIAANTNASGGYLYIVAYAVPMPDVPLEIVTPTPPPVVRWYETPHAYVEVADWYQKRKPCEKCSEYKSAPIHKGQ